MRAFFLLLAALAGLGLPVVTFASQRDLLWRVVQTCVLNHRLTGLAFPCLDVDAEGGPNRGHAVLRALGDQSHLILTPIARTPGVEAPRLRGRDATNYFADAWEARSFLVRGLARTPGRVDMGLAINSRPGRSQDQLHIHIACLQPEVKRALGAADVRIKAHPWSKVTVLRFARPYIVRYVPGDDLRVVNPFDEVAEAFQMRDPAELGDVTIVVAGAQQGGFYVMARRKAPRIFDQPHGEALLDPDCDGFR